MTEQTTIDETVRTPGPSAQEAKELARPSPFARVLSLALPGVGHVLSGRPFAGMWLVLAWGALLGSLWLGWNAITGIRRRSRPGQRTYVRKDAIPKIRSGLGIAILSTSRGLMTDRAARKAGVGGELLCEVW